MTHKVLLAAASQIMKAGLFARYLLAFCTAFTTGAFLAGTATAQQGLLWKITGKDLQKPSYLLGTIHYYPKSEMTLPDTLFKLQETCSQLALELNFEDVMGGNFDFLQKDSAKTLDKVLDDQTYSKLLQLADSIPFLKPFKASLKNMKPMFVAMYLFTPSDMTKSGSVDMELYQSAKGSGKKVKGLETLDEQLTAIEKIDFEQQVKLLKKAIEDFSKRDEALSDLARQYRKQDLDELLEEVQEQDNSGSLNDELLKRRNQKMLERSLPLLPETVFIAVGAAHLAGKDGLIELLKQKGYTLTPVEVRF